MSTTPASLSTEQLYWRCDPALLDSPVLKPAITPVAAQPQWGVWTDDRTSILPIIKW